MRRRSKSRVFNRKGMKWEAICLCAAVIIVSAAAIHSSSNRPPVQTNTSMTAMTDGSADTSLTASSAHSSESVTASDSSQTASSLSEQAETASTEEDSDIDFSPHCVAETEPSRLIEGTDLQVNGELLEDQSHYQPWYSFDFGKGSTYTDVDGIVTFRGNNFRDAPSYGTADMRKNTLETVWTGQTGSTVYGNASWSGNGWTGQPLIEVWPKEVRQHINMYDEFKDRDELTEVIYAGMDGYVRFYDLDTGKPTRDPVNLGWTFKGSGALDPRGYPILYLGAGYDSYKGIAHVFVINLLDGSVMYEFGQNDPFGMRGTLSYFDSSALVDASSDTLIYPGENGVLYLIRLNTKYDASKGTLSIDPSDVVEWRYHGVRTSSASYWPGMEDSAAVYRGYMFIADNGGNLLCVDLNTLQIIWAQDVLDDTNSTPVLSEEDGHLYLYESTSFHLGWRSSSTADIPVWKIDAETGEIVWHTDYNCSSMAGVSGGVQSTIAVGQNDLSDRIYVTVSMTGSTAGGVLACLDKKTGKSLWEHRAGYAWSSPVCVYRPDGSGNVIYCSSDGNMYLLDGKTGEVYDTLRLSQGVIEASPAVYKDMAVVGTRACTTYGIRLS